MAISGVVMSSADILGPQDVSDWLSRPEHPCVLQTKTSKTESRAKFVRASWVSSLVGFRRQSESVAGLESVGDVRVRRSRVCKKRNERRIIECH